MWSLQLLLIALLAVALLLPVHSYYYSYRQRSVHSDLNKYPIARKPILTANGVADIGIMRIEPALRIRDRQGVKHYKNKPKRGKLDIKRFDLRQLQSSSIPEKRVNPKANLSFYLTCDEAVGRHLQQKNSNIGLQYIRGFLKQLIASIVQSMSNISDCIIERPPIFLAI